METKPFYLTSEFWASLAAVIAALAGAFPVSGRIASILAVAVTGAYAISRGLAKSGSSPVPVVPVDEGDKGSP